MNNPCYLLLSKISYFGVKIKVLLGFWPTFRKWINMWFTEAERYAALIPTMAKTLHDSEHESPIHCRSPKNMLFFFGAKDTEFLDVSFLRVGCSSNMCPESGPNVGNFNTCHRVTKPRSHSYPGYPGCRARLGAAGKALVERVESALVPKWAESCCPHGWWWW